MGILRRLREWWQKITADPVMPERDAFQAETERRRHDSTMRIARTEVPRTEPAPPTVNLSRPSPAARVRRLGVVVVVAMLAMSGCATFVGAVDTVAETIRTIETDFGPYIAALPAEVQAQLISQWAKVKAAIAAAQAVIAPIR